MAEFKRKEDHGTLRLRFNIVKLVQESEKLELGGAEWHFKAERRTQEAAGIAGQNALDINGMDAQVERVFVGAHDLVDIHLGRGRLSRRHLLRVTIFRKLLLIDVPAIVDYEICLKGSKADMVVKGEHTFEGEDEVQSFSIESFMGWYQLLFPGNGFVDNNNVMTIFLDIRLRDTINRMNIKNALLFSVSTPFPAADCVLLVEEKQVHVSKAFLAIHSPIFNELFEQKHGNEFELSDLGYYKFLELLAVIYPSLQPIIDSNVENVLTLASRFKMSNVVEDCERFLMFNSALPSGKKILLAQRFGLDGLRVNCVRQCLSYDDVKNMGEEYHSFDSTTKCMLLENLTTEASKKKKKEKKEKEKPKIDMSNRSSFMF